MLCPHCKKELKLQIGTKINCENCKVLGVITSVVTVQCDSCKHLFQVPLQSKSVLSVKDENKKS